MLNNNKTGFSILEITIAIFIILMGFISLLSLNTQNLKIQNANKNNLIASQLAQEGLELVRNFRDSNWNAGIPYSTGIYDENNLYTVDYDNSALISSFPNWDHADARLYIKDNYYKHDNSGTPAQFYRYIRTTTADISRYFQVECVVYWYEKGDKREYKAETLLYDWE